MVSHISAYPSFPDFSGISEYDRSLFNALNATIPAIAPRGNRAGDFDGVQYGSPSFLLSEHLAMKE